MCFKFSSKFESYFKQKHSCKIFNKFVRKNVVYPLNGFCFSDLSNITPQVLSILMVLYGATKIKALFLGKIQNRLCKLKGKFVGDPLYVLF